MQAHGLVGIYRDRREECSACCTFDLEALDEEGGDPADQERVEDVA